MKDKSQIAEEEEVPGAGSLGGQPRHLTSRPHHHDHAVQDDMHAFQPLMAFGVWWQARCCSSAVSGLPWPGCMRDRAGNGEGERRRGGGPPGPRPHRPVTISAGAGTGARAGNYWANRVRAGPDAGTEHSEHR